MTTELLVLQVAQVLIFAFGGTVVYFAARAYRRKNSRSMFLLAVGYGAVTAGAVIGGLLFELLGTDLTTVEAVQAACQAFGFFVILYSLAWTKS